MKIGNSQQRYQGFLKIIDAKMSQNEGITSAENIRTATELILDEHKLVTYISLSKDMCIHVNQAKNLLSKVVDEIKVKNTNIHLNVTYLISGLTSNNNGLVTVCPENELKTRKDTFKTIHFQHIYSVSKGSSGLDNAALVSVNKFDDLLLCGGLVKGLSCTKRSSDEIGTIKSNSQKSLDSEKPVVRIKKEVKEKSNYVDSTPNNIVKIHETKSEPVMKSEVISPKKDSFSSINGKSTAKNGVKPSKGIAGFFSKSNSASSIKPKSVIESETIEKIKPELKEEVNPKLNHEEEDMDVDVEAPMKEVTKEPESVKKVKNKKNSSLSTIKKNAKVDKKRKRVLHVSDSDSDDPFADDKEPENHESEDEIPQTPTVSTVKVTGILNPKKKRKIVDKTYTDEEGYILTRKEEVYESCSDEEMEVKVEPAQMKSEKENIEKTNNAKIEISPKKTKTEISPKEKRAKNTKKKVSPPQKGKQANIMSFFKKV